MQSTSAGVLLTGRDRAGATGSTQRKKPRRRRRRAGYLFLLPWFVGFFGIVAGPMVASLYLAFTNFHPGQTARWIGPANFIQMFTSDPQFYPALEVTAIYVVVGVPLQLLVSLVLAYVLDRGIRGLTIYRAIFYLPSLMGGSVAIALLWRQVFGLDGLFNQLLAIVGLHGQSWIGNPNYALSTLILLLMWQFGSPMLIFLAGLRQIPAALYDAAALDGAGRWGRFRSVTLPLLSPVLFFNLVLQIINSFQAFTSAYIVSGGTGGPANSTLFYTLDLYNEGFTFLNMGYASAMAWVLLCIIGLLTAVNFLASKYWVFYDD